MLKKAGIVVAAAAAGLLAVSPLAFAGERVATGATTRATTRATTSRTPSTTTTPSSTTTRRRATSPGRTPRTGSPSPPPASLPRSSAWRPGHPGRRADQRQRPGSDPELQQRRGRAQPAHRPQPQRQRPARTTALAKARTPVGPGLRRGHDTGLPTHDQCEELNRGSPEWEITFSARECGHSMVVEICFRGPSDNFLWLAGLPLQSSPNEMMRLRRSHHQSGETVLKKAAIVVAGLGRRYPLAAVPARAWRTAPTTPRSATSPQARPTGPSAVRRPAPVAGRCWALPSRQRHPCTVNAQTRPDPGLQQHRGHSQPSHRPQPQNVARSTAGPRNRRTPRGSGPSCFPSPRNRSGGVGRRSRGSRAGSRPCGTPASRPRRTRTPSAPTATAGSPTAAAPPTCG